MLTDEDGNIAERRHFDAWGQPIKVEDSAGNTLDKLTLLTVALQDTNTYKR
nr:hypothetical protein [Capnocytophaga sp. oral taxon 903]